MIFTLFNFFNNDKVSTSKEDFQIELDTAFDIKSDENDDMETISLTSDNDDQTSYNTLDDNNTLAIIMNTPEGITELSEAIMKELDEIVKIIKPNVFLVLNNKYQDLIRLLDYNQLTVIILNDMIKSELVLNLPDYAKKFYIELEEDFDPINSIFCENPKDCKNLLNRSNSSPGDFFLEEIKCEKISKLKNSLKHQVEEIIKILNL